MTGRVVPFFSANIGPHQRVNHAHIEEDLIVLHWHKPDAEPEGGPGVEVSRGMWSRLMDAVYWKREETLEPAEGEGGNVVALDAHVGFAVFHFKRGRQQAEEEVAVPSLQQADARLRRRNR